MYSDEFGIGTGLQDVEGRRYNQVPVGGGGGAPQSRHLGYTGERPYMVPGGGQHLQERPEGPGTTSQTNYPHERGQSQHAGMQQYQQNGQYPPHGRYVSSSQLQPSSSPHFRVNSQQSIPATASPSLSSHQHQQPPIRYAQTRPTNPSSSTYQSPGVVPSPTHANFPQAPSPHPRDPYHHPQTQLQSQTQPDMQQRQAGPSQASARRRMSIEQSIAANLPPPSGSPHRNAPPPVHPQQPQQYRMAQPNSGQVPTPRRIEEEEQEEVTRSQRDQSLHSRNPSQPQPQPQSQPQAHFVESSNTQRDNAAPQPQARRSSESEEGPVPSISTAIFHTYVLDYLQRAGFLSTAAAFLSEKPSIFTHPLESGRSYPSVSAGKARQVKSSSTLQSPTSASNPLLRESPRSMPLFRSDSGSSPVSPSQQDASNHSTIESTTSSSTTTSHFGFDRSKSHGMDEEGPSPGDDKERNGSRNEGGRRRIPAADVEHEVNGNGFLFEWFHVFHDVHSAKLRTGGSAQARALLATNSANPTIGKRLRPLPAGRIPAQLQQFAQATAGRPSPINAQQARTAPLVARRPSNAQLLPQGRVVAQNTTVPSRTIMDRGPPVQTTAPIARQAPPLVRRNSQQQFIQHQRENQARQTERQKLQQLQIEQVEAQNEMLSGAKQNASSPTIKTPTGVTGYVPDRLARTNETLNTFYASLVAKQRSQFTQGSPSYQPLASSPQPIPDGSRYVLREPIPHDQSEENVSKPGLQRTLSQPHIQQVPSQDMLMPPSASLAPGSSQARPPLVRSASTSIVPEEHTASDLTEERPSQAMKRRRDSVTSTSGLDTRELKKVRSNAELGSQARNTLPVSKSPLAIETDFTASSPPPSSAVDASTAAPDHDSQDTKEENSDPAPPTPLDTNPPQEVRSQPVVSLEDTEALLATLDATNGSGGTASISADPSSINELDVPTMTDAELDAFFANSMNTLDEPNPQNSLPLDDKNMNPSISIPDTADFDFSEYDSFFGSGAASYDPTTYTTNYDLRV
ncbi:uncharacterized protein JCM6883_002238 [Sporobolomyces salmoneus]|uniref:uncharacterized protein n=1 Tax=Sporobolomyces salmoneus TaxID=183962 RepID=UPI003178CE44